MRRSRITDGRRPLMDLGSSIRRNDKRYIGRKGLAAEHLNGRANSAREGQRCPNVLHQAVYQRSKISSWSVA
jgi:hypothetical protein